MNFERIIRAALTAISSVGSPIEQLFFGAKDDNKFKRIIQNSDKSDKALRIERDKEGNMINNSYDFGEI